MDQDILAVINEVNAYIRQKDWYDFDILELKGGVLTIVGSTDFSYYHDIEIDFQDVFFIHCNSSWKVDTSQNMLMVPTIEEQKKINLENLIEEGYLIIKIITEYQKVFFISAKSISARFGTVYYSTHPSVL